MLKALAAAAWLGLAAAPALGAAPERQEAPLGPRDPALDLRQAEKDVKRSGDADSYAARADAKRALGRPYQDYLADYMEAARRDPKKYSEKVQGVIDQHESQAGHEAKRHEVSASGKDSDIIARVLLGATFGFLVLMAGLVLIRGRSGASG